MALKNLHQIFYYHSKYLNSMKCQEISMGPSIWTIQCSNNIESSKNNEHSVVRTLVEFRLPTESNWVWMDEIYLDEQFIHLKATNAFKKTF
jgi:hypothetical protein